MKRKIGAKQKLMAVGRLIKESLSDAKESLRAYARGYSAAYYPEDRLKQDEKDKSINGPTEVLYVYGFLSAYAMPMITTVIALGEMYGGGPNAHGINPVDQAVLTGSILGQPMLYDGIRRLKRAYKSKLEEVVCEEAR